MKKNEYTKTCNYPADALKIPESPDLERAVLGALMVFPESVADVRGILTSTAFYDPQKMLFANSMTGEYFQTFTRFSRS